ncbi:ATP-dependent DNA helicase RecG [Murdochiella vaginalis]|uniref:ATP-dependent DNA helicase RecG n=1 Tax=Murdochiella vaginalis TaxID=1852373 RepID=UPI0008FE4151|nr:ATP-dependent DNA helicase RecG [Murdochiella vaginalis]
MSTPITAVKGVGPKKAESFGRLGITTVEELLYALPFRYEDRRHVCAISALSDGLKQVVFARLTRIYRPVRLGGRRTIVRASVADDSESLTVVWHNQPYITRNLRVGDSFYFYGTYREANHVLFDPLLAKAETEKEGKENFLGLFPQYSLTDGLSQNARRDAVKQAFSLLSQVEDPYPSSWRIKAGWRPLYDLLKALHFPTSMQELDAAREEWQNREALEETLVRHFWERSKHTKQSVSMRPCNLTKAMARLPFILTNAQKNAVMLLQERLCAPSPMNVLLQGDVGSGKTVVAFLAAECALENGYHVAFMAPSEVLARQHAEKARSFFTQPVYLLTGSTTEEARKKMDAAAKGTKPGIFFGTHALFQDRVRFSRLGLVITDEQHRFGVRQRARLQEKSEQLNTLVLSATPIPRTLALVEWGDLELVRIHEKPPGRGTITTRIVDRRSEKACYHAIARQIVKGRQVYIVCPVIESGEDNEQYWSVTETEKRVRAVMKKEENVVGRKVVIDTLTGKQSSESKREVMDRFYRGKSDLLIATTVIEVGIDVANAGVMMIAEAERFGLAQLHQLRGRVGRGQENAYCILMLHSSSIENKQRLRVLEQTLDGWEIARADLRLRGSGDRLGTRQHGLTLSDEDQRKWQEALAQSARWLQTQKVPLDRLEALPSPLRERIRERMERIRQVTLN